MTKRSKIKGDPCFRGDDGHRQGVIPAKAGIHFALLLLVAPSIADACTGVVYLTLDTGTMRHAEAIAGILKKHDVRATFFLANEPTVRGDMALDESWAGYWKARVAEGHAFGTHTWRHGRITENAGGIGYRPQFGEDAGRALVLQPAQFCAELRRVDEVFARQTGQRLDALWRAPGGHVTNSAQSAARECGYAHVHWAPAGFLGDELPSETYSNAALLARALRDVRDGDVLMAHLGIRSRKDPFAPMLDPLIAGLKERGVCFRTLREHPGYRAQTPPALLAAAAPATTAKSTNRPATNR